MGDRGNIALKQRDGSMIYLYSHWSGSNLPMVLHSVLSRKKRWEDSPYLGRMIFCEMVKGCENEETGFGICNEICDNEHPIIVVDCLKQQVRFEHSERIASEMQTLIVMLTCSFSEFISMNECEINLKFTPNYYDHPFICL